MVAEDSTRPGMSAPAASGSFEAGTTRATRIAAAAATGAIAMKMLAQLNCSSSQPPTIGPVAMATPATAPHKPIARARSVRSVKTLDISDSVAGKVIAAPSPITDRAAMSCAGSVVKPPARLAAPNTASPASSMPLRPNRSDRLPNVSSSAAKTRLKESTTHSSCVVVACNSRTRAGSATFTRVVSRLTRNAPSSSATRIMGLDRIGSPPGWFVLGQRSGSCGGPGVGRLDLEVGHPPEPSGQVPAAVAEEAQGAGQDDHADERGVQEQGGGDTEAHLLEHDELSAGEAAEHDDDDEGGPSDDLGGGGDSV